MCLEGVPENLGNRVVVEILLLALKRLSFICHSRTFYVRITSLKNIGEGLVRPCFFLYPLQNSFQKIRLEIKYNWTFWVVSAIVSRGDWLGKPANIKAENNGAVGYVESSLTVRSPLFFVHKL